VGLLNISVVLVDRLAEITGRTPSDLMAEVALQLETAED
jgi:mRNA-degrading endonuclease toxin of MazEF toxin-antitoxin module